MAQTLGICLNTRTAMATIANPTMPAPHCTTATDAITESVRTRVRPIYMSSITTVFGMLPLVLSTGPGSELYRGLGSILLGGLAVFGAIACSSSQEDASGSQTAQKQTGKDTEATQAVSGLDLQLIRGVEISVTWQAMTIHVLGLNVAPRNPALSDGLQELQKIRDWRAGEISRKLANKGIPGALQGARGRRQV